MEKLKPSDLYTLEEYDRKRNKIRAQVMQYKKSRIVRLGEHLSLYFEDRTTIHYQVQEMLRVERIYTVGDIAEELSTYNPLIPDGANWKATMMIEYKDPQERAKRLQELIAIERKLYVQIAALEKVYPIANEDLTRETSDKTSAVHFLRFELTDEMVKAVQDGANIRFGVEHPNYSTTNDANAETCLSLTNDLS